MQHSGAGTGHRKGCRGIIRSGRHAGKKLVSVRIRIAMPCEKDPNLKQTEPLMSDLAANLKGRASDISAITARLLNLVQTVEL